MGYFRDEHLIITSFEKDVLDVIRVKLIDKIAKNLLDDDYGKPQQTAKQFIPPVIATLANTSYILYVPMDGSKEGWTISSDMDKVRAWLYREVDKINAKDDKNHIGVIRIENCDYNGLSVEKIE